MRILVVGPSYQNQPKSIAGALSRLGHDVQICPLAEFYVGCTYWQRKLYKLGIKIVEEKYNKKQAAALELVCNQFNPDLVFILNGLMISPLALESIKKYEKILWMWDSLVRCPKLEEILPYFKNIFVFEWGDVEKLKDRGINAIYLPLGYDEQIFYPKEKRRDIDISFIGVPNEDRLEILNKISQYAEKKNLNMFVGGPWYSTRHFWKKKNFSTKYPSLCRYIHNCVIKPEEAADIYNRSKICLNINVAEHKSLNPRSFEIMATKSLMLMNGDIDFRGLIHDNDYVHFMDADDVIDRIQEIMSDDVYRESIALNGYESVSINTSYIELMKTII